MYELTLFTIAIVAGCLGAILGLGGGVIMVPVLTLGYGIHIRYAIAASLISIVATSSGAAASYLKDNLTNLRVGVLLEVGTVSGAVVGFLLASYVKSQFLFLAFGSFLLFSAVAMLRKREESISTTGHPWSDKLNLNSSYPDSKGHEIKYKVEQVPFALLAMFGAGVTSALLGVGGGVMKVIAMDGAMKLPIKVSSATSNFMIGVTASASAGAYLLKGDVVPSIAAPVATGIIIGSYFGAKLMIRLPAPTIRKIFVIVLIVISTQMIFEGLK